MAWQFFSTIFEWVIALLSCFLLFFVLAKDAEIETETETETVAVAGAGAAVYVCMLLVHFTSLSLTKYGTMRKKTQLCVTHGDVKTAGTAADTATQKYVFLAAAICGGCCPSPSDPRALSPLNPRSRQAQAQGAGAGHTRRRDRFNKRHNGKSPS